MNKKSKIIFVVVLLATCIISFGLTFVVKNNGTKYSEDDIIIAVAGKEEATKITQRDYSFSRTYIMKDGTIIEGSKGNNSGKINIE